jgi:hypothetical protein
MSEIVIAFTDGSTFAVDGNFIITCYAGEEIEHQWESEVDSIEYISVNQLVKQEI